MCTLANAACACTSLSPLDDPPWARFWARSNRPRRAASRPASEVVDAAVVRPFRFRGSCVSLDSAATRPRTVISMEALYKSPGLASRIEELRCSSNGDGSVDFTRVFTFDIHKSGRSNQYV